MLLISPTALPKKRIPSQYQKVVVLEVFLGADVLAHVPALAAPVPVLEEEGKYSFCILFDICC